MEPENNPRELSPDVNINEHSSFYRKKEKFDINDPGNRQEGSEKGINDAFYGTGDDPRNTPLTDRQPTNNDAAEQHDDYDAETNSGGSQSATDKQED